MKTQCIGRSKVPHRIRLTGVHGTRRKHIEADELAKAAAQNLPLPLDIFAQALTIKAIKEEEDNPATVHAISDED